MVEHPAKGKEQPDECRRSPRFTCGGYVEITWLPSSGIYVPGKIRDLSLDGCCIDTKLPTDGCTRAEIVVRTKSNSFRAIGEVRAVRSGIGAGLEFVRLSAGGKGLLKDLMADLEKVQAAIDKPQVGSEESKSRTASAGIEISKTTGRNVAYEIPVSVADSTRANFASRANALHPAPSRRRGAAARDPDRFIRLGNQIAMSTTPQATSNAAIHRRRPTRSCRKTRAATALATKVSEADAGTTRLRFPHESPKSRL